MLACVCNKRVTFSSADPLQKKPCHVVGVAAHVLTSDIRVKTGVLLCDADPARDNNISCYTWYLVVNSADFDELR